jgi:fucose permease
MGMPNQEITSENKHSLGLVLFLTYLMFLMFAMTTDAVGVIIPKIIEEFKLSMTEAGAFHYSTMSGIALAGLFLGSLADKLGRKWSIIVGLSAYAIACLAFAIVNHFAFFLVLLFISGAAIGVFKTAAIALIGDLTNSSQQHTKIMNMVEGFFAIGAIIGPWLVTQLLLHGASWKWLYIFAAFICVILVLTASRVAYPKTIKTEAIPKVSFSEVIPLLKDKHLLSFSALIMLYVGAENAIFVWMPSFLKNYKGDLQFFAIYALPIFFVLRAFGRFLGSWLMSHLKWTVVLSLCSALIALCFIGSVVGGRGGAVLLLPLSGLFMSVIYPTLNSKGISGFHKSQHGAIGGIILFFTCLSAVIAPLLMGMLSDYFGDAKYGFYLATFFAIILFVALLFNHLSNASESRLKEVDNGLGQVQG